MQTSRAQHLKLLIGSSHYQPAIGVTTLVTVYSLIAGVGFQAIIVALAVLTGQFSIGLSNNYYDVANDKKSGRSDKPAVNNQLPKEYLLLAACLFLLATIPLSLSLSLQAGSIHIGAVAFGWAYNINLKNTPLSVLMYMSAFALIPYFVATLTNSTTSFLTVLAFSFLGSTIHFLDAIKDYDLDNTAGIRGFVNIFTKPASIQLMKLSILFFMITSVLALII